MISYDDSDAPVDDRTAWPCVPHQRASDNRFVQHDGFMTAVAHVHQEYVSSRSGTTLRTHQRALSGRKRRAVSI